MAIPYREHRVDDLTDEEIGRMVHRDTPRAGVAARECPRCGSMAFEQRLGGEPEETFVCRQCGYEASVVVGAAN
jgi:DNA-directed RNA polymerase subunit M/transcription elongation factor TFIIS